MLQGRWKHVVKSQGALAGPMVPLLVMTSRIEVFDSPRFAKWFLETPWSSASWALNSQDTFST